MIMSKRLLIILLFVPVLTLRAGDDKAWHLGVEGGVDVEKFKVNNEIFSADNRLGWFVGPKLKVKIPLVGFGLDVAALYHRYEMEYTAYNRNVYEKSYHMLAVPLNLRYDIGLIKLFSLYIATGPQYNYAIKENNSDNQRIDLEKHNFDWNVGAGFDLFKHFEIGFNYSIPLGDKIQLNGVKLKGHTWNIRAAIFF